MQDYQQNVEESNELKQAIKFKQENQRVKIRKEKINKQLNFTRLKFVSKDDPDFHDFQNAEIKSLAQVILKFILTINQKYTLKYKNESLVAQKLKQLAIHYNLREYDGCLEIVKFFSQFTIFNSSEQVLKESIEVMNKTDFPLFLIAFISQEIATSFPELFKISLKIMQNVPYIWDQAFINKIVEYRAIDYLVEILRYQQDDSIINNALFSLASFSCTDQMCVQNKLIELKAFSLFATFNKYDAFKTNILYLYECTFGNIKQVTVSDFSEEDQDSFKFIIQFLLNELKFGDQTENEDLIQQVLYSISGLSKIEALVQFNELSEYVLLLNILEQYHKELIMLPAISTVNYLSYNSDKNIEEFINFDYLAVLKQYSDSSNYKIRLHTIYTFMNMAACQSQNIKDILLEKNIVAKFMVMMQEDKPKIKNLCAFFFTNIIIDSSDTFIRRAIQDYYFMNISKQIFEQINDFDVVFSLLKAFEYILECLDNQDLMVYILKQMQYFKINEYIEELTQQYYEHVTDKALVVYEKYQDLVQQLDLD